MLRKVETGKSKVGTAFYYYILLYAMLRLLLDPLRADGRLERYYGLSHQQLISLSIIFLALLFLNRNVFKGKRRLVK